MRKSFGDGENGKVTDHYAQTCEKWRSIFQEMDQEELIQRFHLEEDTEALYVTYYHEKYRLDRETGMLTLVEWPDEVLPFNTVMAIYNLFYYSKPGAKVCGRFVPFRDVKRAAPFDSAFQNTVLKPLARSFSGHSELLEKACLALGGRTIPQGDVGYVIQAFDWMPVTIVFWDGDEEFEAQSNMLFDADITDFLHEETVCCIASDLGRRLIEEAGLETAEKLL